jgi:hypothetical protein
MDFSRNGRFSGIAGMIFSEMADHLSQYMNDFLRSGWARLSKLRGRYSKLTDRVGSRDETFERSIQFAFLPDWQCFDMSIFRENNGRKKSVYESC